MRWFNLYHSSVNQISDKICITITLTNQLIDWQLNFHSLVGFNLIHLRVYYMTCHEIDKGTCLPAWTGKQSLNPVQETQVLPEARESHARRLPNSQLNRTTHGINKVLKINQNDELISWGKWKLKKKKQIWLKCKVHW